MGEIFEKVNKQINPQNEAGKTVYVGLENIESNSGNLVGEVNAEMKSIKSTKTVFRKGDILYGKLRLAGTPYTRHRICNIIKSIWAIQNTTFA